MADEVMYDLNQGQKDAAEAFFQFLFSDKKEFILSGRAGVGKTFLMSYIIDNTLPRYHEMCKLVGLEPKYDNVTMTATTNKAAEVLAEATKRPTQTIHSFLNLKVKEDYKTGRMNLTKTGAWFIHTNKIIFIDECSMIDSPLKSVINEGTQNCKIVYVGDHNQLAPVMEKISSIYVHDIPFYELTEQMRNANQPALMEVCTQLKQTVETGIFNPIKIVPGVIDLLDGKQMEETINSYFLNQTTDSRILAYTNKRVIDYNNHVRTIRNLPEAYQIGELLVNNSVVKIGKTMMPVEASVEIIRNHGPEKIKIDNDVYLDVDKVDFKNNIGDIFTNANVPTNRTHFNQLIKYYSSTKNFERMFFLKQNFFDLRPRDAATVHKSQGSTYDNVFIDLENISSCNMPNQTARMLYVAFSRARSRVFLYGNLADKYGGILQQ